MDLGLKPATTAYYAELEDRIQRSREAGERLGQQGWRKRREAEKAAEEAAKEAEPTPEPAPEPTPVETAQEDLTRAVDELTMDPGERAARERAAGTPEMDLGTAAGAAAERAAAERTARSRAEREAADALLRGRRSTILTTPGGLLAPSEQQVTAGRSLIGGSRRRREMT